MLTEQVVCGLLTDVTALFERPAFAARLPPLSRSGLLRKFLKTDTDSVGAATGGRSFPMRRFGSIQG